MPTYITVLFAMLAGGGVAMLYAIAVILQQILMELRYKRLGKK